MHVVAQRFGKVSGLQSGAFSSRFRLVFHVVVRQFSSFSCVMLEMGLSLAQTLFGALWPLIVADTVVIRHLTRGFEHFQILLAEKHQHDISLVNSNFLAQKLYHPVEFHEFRYLMVLQSASLAVLRLLR